MSGKIRRPLQSASLRLGSGYRKAGGIFGKKTGERAMFGMTKPPTKSRRGIPTLWASCGFLVLAGITPLDELRAQSAGAIDPVVQARPADEAALMMEDKATAEVRAAPNDIVRSQVHERWDKTFCAAIDNVKNFTNWTGRVHDINFNGYFEVNIGQYIILYDLDITSSTPLFKILSGLHNDQPIIISGYFIHDAESCAIFVDRTFKVHLTSIAPL